MPDVGQRWIAYLQTQPEWRCIFTGSSEVDCCHLRHGSNKDDLQVFPATHEFHMQIHTEGARFWTPVRLGDLWEWIEKQFQLWENFKEE